MVTSYNKKDMTRFGQHVANWIKNGMILKNENGIYPITEHDVENWQVGENASYSICPKVLSTAQMITHQKVGFNRDLLSNKITLGRVKNTLETAYSEGVVVVYPLIDSNGGVIVDSNGSPKIGTYPMCLDKIVRYVTIREERSDFPYAHASVPFAQFPIYEFDRVVAFGACFHISDVLPDETECKPVNKAYANSPDCA